LTTLLSFAFVLGVLVFVHELGHFLAAKRVGIRVLKFQLGFNPTIVKFRRGDTEYGIGALPLGGYVKMAGENPEDVARDERGELVKRSDEFLSKTKWERFQVLIMGPVMNLLLAFVLTAVVLYQGIEKAAYDDEPPVVGAVAEGSAASKTDIKPGDKIISVAGREVDTWEDFFLQISQRPKRDTELKLLRNGFEITRQVTPTQVSQSRFEIGEIGVLPDVHPFVPRVNQGEPADKAGIKPGDVILAVDGKRITFRPELINAIASKPNTPITITIQRNNQQQNVQVTPTLGGCVGVTAKIGCIGVQIGEPTKSIKPSLGGALEMSVSKNAEYAKIIFQTLWGLVTRETSLKQLMGPVAIAQLSGESVQLGWVALFSLMASISLNLGLLNLMPIPVLDGGHIFIMMLEGIARRDFSVRVKEKMLIAGFVVILMLMVTVIYNDLMRISWIERLMPWR